MHWDPDTYLRYQRERDRPFHDLVSRIPIEQPRAVVDLGCGTGHLTATLATRWPQAKVSGLDAAPEMVAKARSLRTGVDFTVGDLRDWLPGPQVDVVVSNAVLQWVPDHEELLLRWVRRLPVGACLAVAVPGNFAAPSHRALRAVAADPRWRSRLASVLRDATPVRDAIGYATLLRAAGCTVDAWETTYLHLLPAQPTGEHPILAWMDGTALRPVRTALTGVDSAWADFRTELARRLTEHYPIEPGGEVYFPFRRIFFVARINACP